MLSLLDADFVRRDPEIPGLGLILDSQALVNCLASSLPNLNFGNASSHYLRYKPNTNCLIGYQVEVNGENIDIHAKALRFDKHGKLKKLAKYPALPGALGNGRILLENHLTVVNVAPNDAKLKGLPYLAQLNSQPEKLQQLFPQQPQLWQGKLKRLRYKTERRYVAQLLVENQPQALLKAYTDEAYQVAYNNATKFQSRSVLRLAKPIGGSQSHNIIGFEWLPGSLLSEVILKPNLELSLIETVGVALAELHTQQPNKLESMTREAEAKNLLSLANWLSLVYPPVSKQINCLTQKLIDDLVSLPAFNYPIHGDFYADQVLINGENIAIIDLDRAMGGDPAADLGNFLAHLERQALHSNLPDGKLSHGELSHGELSHSKLSRSQISRIYEALQSGYQTILPESIAARIKLYTAIGLFRLTPEPFRHRESNWSQTIAILLDRIEQILPKP